MLARHRLRRLPLARRPCKWRAQPSRQLPRGLPHAGEPSWRVGYAAIAVDHDADRERHELYGLGVDGFGGCRGCRQSGKCLYRVRRALPQQSDAGHDVVRDLHEVLAHTAALGRMSDKPLFLLIGNRSWPSGALAGGLKLKACVSMGRRVTKVGPEVKHGLFRLLVISGRRAVTFKGDYSNCTCGCISFMRMQRTVAAHHSSSRSNRALAPYRVYWLSSVLECLALKAPRTRKPLFHL